MKDEEPGADQSPDHPRYPDVNASRIISRDELVAAQAQTEPAAPATSPGTFTQAFEQYADPPGRAAEANAAAAPPPEEAPPDTPNLSFTQVFGQYSSAQSEPRERPPAEVRAAAEAHPLLPSPPSPKS